MPHSAPTAWLKHDPGLEPPASDAVGPQLLEPEDLSPEQRRHQEIDAFLAAYERIAPEPSAATVGRRSCASFSSR
jgi:hypothetical protein